MRIGVVRIEDLGLRGDGKEDGDIDKDGGARRGRLGAD